MKKSLFIAAFAAATSLAMLAPAAHAADGTITINGSISGTTCTISNTMGSGTNFTMNLPTVSASSLSKPGSFSGRTPFSIILTNCVPATGTVWTQFEPGPTVDTSTGGLVLDPVPGVATNVEVWILNNQFNQIIVGAAGQVAQNSPIVNITGGSATLTYYAEYYSKTGGATPGIANTSVLYTMVYP